MTNNIVVLDTSVLLAEGKRVLYKFENTDLVIPLVVLKELEGKKDNLGLGKPARSVIREIDRLRNDQSKKIGEGVQLPNGSTLRVELNHISVPDGDEFPAPLKDSSNDTRIVVVAYNLKQETDAEVVLATRDLSLAIFAELVGVSSVTAEYAPESREFIDSMAEFEVDWEDLEILFQNSTHRFEIDVPVNTGVVLKAGTASALAIAKPEWRFTLVKDQSISIPGSKAVIAKTKEQQIAIKLLHDDTVKMVSLGGIAGGGKTMLALAEGARQVLNGEYGKITVFRSMSAVGGEELGFLPGTESEKMDPWTAAVYDALESVMPKTDVQKLKQQQKIEVLPLTHVRGRTFSNAWIIVDEAQNLSKSTILTLLTRVGQSSKITLTHDISQRDNHRVGRHEGIYEVVSKFHGSKLFGHIAMKKSERSELAQEADRILNDF